MLGVAVWSERRHQPVLEPPLDHLILVGCRFADADVDFISVAIDRHVPMAGPVMFCPALDQIATDLENKCLIREVNESLLAEYVPAQRGDAAIAVLSGKLRQGEVRKLLAGRKIDDKCDKRALLVCGAHHDAVAIPCRIALVWTELKFPICL